MPDGSYELAGYRLSLGAAGPEVENGGTFHVGDLAPWQMWKTGGDFHIGDLARSQKWKTGGDFHIAGHAAAPEVESGPLIPCPGARLWPKLNLAADSMSGALGCGRS